MILLRCNCQAWPKTQDINVHGLHLIPRLLAFELRGQQQLRKVAFISSPWAQRAGVFAFLPLGVTRSRNTTLGAMLRAESWRFQVSSPEVAFELFRFAPRSSQSWAKRDGVHRGSGDLKSAREDTLSI